MEVTVEETVAASADKVWQAMSNFTGIEPSATIQGVAIEGSGVGAIRTLTMVGGGVIRERLEAFDPAARIFTYAIINKDGPLPVDDYVSTVTISAIDADSARVHWSAQCQPRGVPAEKVTSIISAVYKGGIQRARVKLGLVAVA